jgi:hypothetical protein
MKIFISYAKNDTQEFALKLHKELNKIPCVTPWMDKSLEYGKAWEPKLLREVESCNRMIVLLSPDVNRHDSYVKKEIGLALKHNKNILPVVAQKPVTIPETIAHIQYIDVSEDRNAVDRIVAYISNVSSMDNSRFRGLAGRIDQIKVNEALCISEIHYGEGPNVQAVTDLSQITLPSDVKLPRDKEKNFVIKEMFSEEELVDIGKMSVYHYPREIIIKGERSEMGTIVVLFVCSDLAYLQDCPDYQVNTLVLC